MNKKSKDIMVRSNIEFRLCVSNITRVIAICIALAYTGLAAQSKGFTDTVILKNGTVLSGVKATVTKDSLVVTNPEGETSVFTKKEVSEVKKGEAGNSTNTTKSDPKPTPSSGKWSAYQGKMNWEDAKAQCASIGMRLPTIEELKVAYEAKITDSWENDGDRYLYWSSTPFGATRAYYFSIYDGGSYDYSRRGEDSVRCVR